MRYEDYLNKASDTLTLEKANKLLAEIESSIDVHDEDARELYNDFLEGSFAYANVRAGWLLLSKEEKMNEDKGRTLKHDSVINRVNILARYLERLMSFSADTEGKKKGKNDSILSAGFLAENGFM